jgi:protein-S-isoprenylcysteine O-methyltransferase Ste14
MRSAVGEVCSLTGAGLVIIAVLGRLWSLAYISGHKNSTLVQEGPYSCTRNPLYLFSFVGAIGIGIATCSVAVLAAIVGFFLLYYPLVVRHEESVLASMHGVAFEAYRRRVPRFLPRPGIYREIEERTIRVQAYRRAFLDAFGLVLGLIAVDVLVWLRISGYLPGG